MQLGELSGPDLVAKLRAICGDECRLVAEIVACLVDVDRHKLYLKMASSSLYGFCVERLGMSEGAAYRRINAARLVRQFPALLPRIARGELHLSGLVLLRKHFTDENVDDLATEVAGLSESKILELLARRAPRPAVPDRISAMPEAQAQVPLPSTPLPTARPQSRSRTEPLSPAAYLVQLTVSAETHAKLVEARNLLSHSVPDGNLAAVVDRALDVLLDRLRRDRLGTGARSRAEVKSDPGAVSRADRRAVFERDGGQCTYRSEDGERCPARSLLQTDHVVARALGGCGDPSNLQLLCGPHNRLKAQQELGAARMEAKRARRTRKARGPVVASPLVVDPGSSGPELCSSHIGGSSDAVVLEVALVEDLMPDAASSTGDGKNASGAGGSSTTSGRASEAPRRRGARSVVVTPFTETRSEDEKRAVFGLASMGFSRPACERAVRGILNRGEPDMSLVTIMQEAIRTLADQRA